MLVLKMLTYGKYAPLFRTSQALKSHLLYSFSNLQWPNKVFSAFRLCSI